MFDLEWNQNKVKMEELSTENLRENIVKGIYAGEKLMLAHYVLQEKGKLEERERISRTLKLSEDNIKSTNNLVKATWAIAIITAIASFSPFLIKLIKALIKY